MGFFDRLAFGWRLGTASLGVVARDKTLMLFPILSGLTGLALVAAFVFGIGPENLVAQAREVRQATRDGGGGEEIPAILYVYAFTAYFVLSFVAVYFNVALIGAAQLSLAGKDTTLGDGFGVANRHLGKITAWAAISGTVGLVLNAIESNGKVGQVVRSILGVAWAVLTYFVVPVMIFENQAPTGAIGRSATLMKGTWGENAGAQVGIGLVVALFVVLLVVVAMAGIVLMPPSAIVLGPLMVVGTLFVVLLGMAAKAVLAVSLYEFATNKGGPSAFKPDELKAAFG
jgi:hypothetical protein